MNILVVENEPIDAKLARVVLASEGYAVSDVGAVEQAISAIQSQKPDLIILDLVLPDVDGLTFARQMKQNPETKDIVILAVTANTSRWSRLEVMKAGCDAYLIKPFGSRKLREQIADLVQKLK